MNNIVTSKKDRGLVRCFCWFYLSLFAVNVTYYAFGESTIYSATSIVSKSVIVLLLFSQAYIIIKSLNGKRLLYIMFIVVFFLFNALLAISKEGYLVELASFGINVLPCLILFLCITNYQHLVLEMTRYGRIIALVAIIMFLIKMTISKGSDYEDNMGFANALVVPSLFLINDYYVYRNKMSLMCILCMMGIGLAVGSRGALFCMGVYFLSFFARGIGQGKYQKRTLLFVLMLMILLINYRGILMLVNSILESKGIHSRTIWIILNDIGHLSGREDIYSQINDALNSHPLMIRGIGGSFSITGTFAHNVFLEIFCEFGAVVGSVVSVSLFVLILQSILFFNRNGIYEVLIVMMFSASIPRLMFSGSIWSSTELWIWLSLLLFRRKHHGITIA